jgi:predicted enzyme related to lactoylglutathione lyase
MSLHPTASISHIGICTSDIDRSVRFYTEALGFVLDRSIDAIGPPYDRLMELPGVKCSVHYLKCGAVTIELIGYPGGGVTGSAGRRPMNQLGFTHMTLVVADVNAAVDLIVNCGGHVHRESEIDSPFGPMVMCTDPDGVRIELMQHAA